MGELTVCSKENSSSSQSFQKNQARMEPIGIDRISAVSGEWLLYNGPDFTGACTLIRSSEGKTYQYKLCDGFDKSAVLSARLLPEEGIILFEREFYQGRSWETSRRSHFERHLNFGARSCILVSEEYDLFTESEFGGKTVRVEYTEESRRFIPDLKAAIKAPVRSFHKKGQNPDETHAVRLSGSHPEMVERARWERLAPKLAAGPEETTDTAKRSGSLYIVGSGLQVGQFTMEAISHIKAADKVFYCIADAPGEQFIQTLRPDAMDLYVYYSDSRIRSHTYVQMAETLLYHLRKGLYVVGVFYGHPGVFVDPSHRALAIARREGFFAKMLPAVSALDCLFADLGIDPAFPGMQTFEATDMLLRKRTIHVDQHVVIWQVGCVLDSSFRRRGYLNHNLNILLDYLIEAYGPDYEVVNYVAAVFCTLEPAIERFRLSELYDPEKAKRVSGLSTWYLAPKVQSMPNMELYKKLRLKVPDKPYTKEMRFYYHEDALSALKELEDFKVPTDYKRTVATQTGSLMIRLSQDGKALEEYRRHPKKALAKMDMTPQLKKLLVNPPSWRLRVLTKPGTQDVVSSFLTQIYMNPAFANEWMEVLGKFGLMEEGEPDVAAWLKEKGYDTTLDDIVAGQAAFEKSSLLPWTGVYQMNFEDCEIVISGSETWYKSLIYYNGFSVRKFKYDNGILSFSSGDGNMVSGELGFVWADDEHTKQALQGRLWKPSQPKPSQNNAYGEAESYESALAVWQGMYKTFIKKDGKWLPGEAVIVDAKNNTVTYQGVEIKNYVYDSSKLAWKKEDGNGRSGALSFYMKKDEETKKSAASFSGTIWDGGPEPAVVNMTGSLDPSYLSPWDGYYYTNLKTGTTVHSGKELVIQAGASPQLSKVFYGGVEIKKFQYATPVLSWSEADGNDTNASLTFYQSSDGQSPYFTGILYEQGGVKPTDHNITGFYDKKYMSSWSGYYKSYLNHTSGPEVIIYGEEARKTSRILVGGVEIKQFTFNNPVISWTDEENGSNGILTFYFSSTTSLKGFSGYFWEKGGSRPDQPNWSGTVDTTYLLSWSGFYYTYKKVDGKYVTGKSFQVIGSEINENCRILFDGVELLNWTFNNPVLTWSESFNSTNGELTFYMPKPSEETTVISPSFAAKIWDKGDRKPDDVNYTGSLTPPAKPYKTPWYMTAMEIVGFAMTFYMVCDLICQFWKGKPLSQTIRNWFRERMEPAREHEAEVNPEEEPIEDVEVEPVQQEQQEMEQQEEQEQEEQEQEEQEQEEQEQEEQEQEEQEQEEQEQEEQEQEEQEQEEQEQEEQEQEEQEQVEQEEAEEVEVAQEEEVVEAEVAEAEVVEAEVVEAEVVEAEVVEVEVVEVEIVEVEVVEVEIIII